MARAAAVKKACRFCRRLYSSNGLVQHERKCERETAAKVNDAEFLRALRGEGLVFPDPTHGRHIRDPNRPLDLPDFPDPFDVVPDDVDDAAGAGDVGAAAGVGNAGAQARRDVPEYSMDDIKVQFHPTSYNPDLVYHFEDYGQRDNDIPPPPADDRPWRPFSSRIDFEFAEFAHEAALNKRQIDTVLKLFQRCSSGEEKLSLSSHGEVDAMWEAASVQVTPVGS